MNILIARAKEECPSWTDVAVVVDVLRGATTACALLERGKRDVLLFKDGASASGFLARHTDFEAFSDEELSAPYADNSPYLASKSIARQPGLLLADSLSRAAFSLRNARTVFLGGFCNFYALAEVLAVQEKDVLLVPASLFGSADEVEDTLCVDALKDFILGIGLPERALGEFGNTLRSVEFHKNGPKTAEKDSVLAFKVNGLHVVPQLTFASDESFAVCHPFGAPAHWLNAAEDAVRADKEEEPHPPTVSLESDDEPAQTSAPKERNQAETPSIQSAAAEPEVQKGKTSSLKGLFAGFSKSVKEEAKSLKEKASSAASSMKEEARTLKDKAAQAAADPKAVQAKSKLKGFFSEIVRSVKEEKEELEQSLLKGNSATRQEERSYELKSDDPFDALMKRSSPENASHVAGADTQAEPKREQTVSPHAQQPEMAPEQEKQRPVSVSASQVRPAEEEPAAREAVELPGEITFSGKASGFDGTKKKKKAIVLFSGGLDSTTCLYWAIEHGYECEALTVSYGQRHDREVLAAQMIARNLGVKHHLITLNLPWLMSSSLVDKNKTIPDVALEDIPKEGIPSTYVPGRNLMFLSIAGSLLDSIGADAIIAGPNAVDFSGYPDCTPAFFKSAADALNRGTKMGVSEGIEVLAPLMRLSKTEIVKLAARLKVPFELTWSCYAGGKKPCGHCDSCKLRAKGFREAGVHDTALD